MNARKIGYIATTSLVTLAFVFGGIMDMSGSKEVLEGMAHLGYPAYVATLIGVWKVLGAAAIAAPGLPRLKEWAYAGIMLDLTGATVSHIASGDGFGMWVTPLVILALAMASWALRPPTRVLGTILGSSGHREHEAVHAHA